MADIKHSEITIDRVSTYQDDCGIWYLEFYTNDIRFGIPINKETIPIFEVAQEKAAEKCFNILPKNGVYCRFCQDTIKYSEMRPWRKDDDTVDMLCPGCDTVLIEGE